MILQESFKYMQAVSDLGRNEHRVSDARYLRREKFLFAWEVRNLKRRQTTRRDINDIDANALLFLCHFMDATIKWLFSVISACFGSHREFEKAYKCENPRSDPIYCLCSTYIRYSSKYRSRNKFSELKPGCANWKIAQWNICHCMFIRLQNKISFLYWYISKSMIDILFKSESVKISLI